MSLTGCKKEDTSQEDQAEAVSSNQALVESVQNEPDQTANIPASTEDASIGELAKLWESGQKDEATAMFLLIDWKDPSASSPIRGLSMSEEDMKSLSEDEIKSIVGETMPLLASMRELFFYIAAEAERLAASGEMGKASEYLTTVKEYGDSLSESNHLHVVQKHGETAVLYADGKLSGLQ
jgi:hypothetical protein